jgi:hypothetical protein
MRKLSVEDQISGLRPVMRFAPHLHKWILAGSATGVFAAFLFWHPMPLMIAIFLGSVGLGSLRVGPNIVSAIVAYDSDTATDGEVSVAIISGESDSYHATVREAGHADWKFDFNPHP